MTRENARERGRGGEIVEVTEKAGGSELNVILAEAGTTERSLKSAEDSETTGEVATPLDVIHGYGTRIYTANENATVFFFSNLTALGGLASRSRLLPGLVIVSVFVWSAE